MSGSAVLTTVTSISSMKTPMHTASSVHHFASIAPSYAGRVQYDRGIPRTCWPTNACTRLLETGATWYRRVSRNLRSMS